MSTIIGLKLNPFSQKYFSTDIQTDRQPNRKGGDTTEDKIVLNAP